MEYSINLAFHFVEALYTYTLYFIFFFMFKAHEHVEVIKQYTCEFLFFIYLRVPQKFRGNKYPLPFLDSFVISSIFTLSINVRLKAAEVFCILNSNGIN